MKDRPQKSAVKLEFSRNDMIAAMHNERSAALKKIAAHFDKFDYTKEQIIEFLREVADEAEAQAMVVNLRDEL